ncbi:hypothetical protein DITRI_Ditri16bG0087800 [Diplodiscus trichospermus]
MIIKDSTGSFVACRTLTLAGSFRVKKGGALGLLEAVKWIKELGFLHVVFEGFLHMVFELDAKIVIDAVKVQEVDATEFGSIIQRCSKSLDQEANYLVRFVQRHANKATHALARWFLSNAGLFTRFEQPSFIHDVVMADCNDAF